MAGIAYIGTIVGLARAGESFVLGDAATTFTNASTTSAGRANMRVNSNVEGKGEGHRTAL